MLGDEGIRLGALSLNGLPDSALACRGGTCTAERFIRGAGVTIDAAGLLRGVSANSAADKTLGELTTNIPNRKIGVSTIGDIRRAGGDVIRRPTSDNPFHCELHGITPEQAEKLFTPTRQNPNILSSTAARAGVVKP